MSNTTPKTPSRKWAHDSAPAPHDETEAYKRFNNILVPVAVVLGVAFNYAMCGFYPVTDATASWLLDWFPWVEGRLNFLKQYDLKSYEAYCASVLGFLIWMGACTIVASVGYWKTVVAPRACRGVDGNTIGVLILYFLSIIFIVGVIFLYSPGNFDPRWPGNARIIFWPTFPFISGMAAYCASIFVFAIPVGILKFIFKICATPIFNRAQP